MGVTFGYVRAALGKAYHGSALRDGDGACLHAAGDFHAVAVGGAHAHRTFGIMVVAEVLVYKDLSLLFAESSHGHRQHAGAFGS